MYFASLGFAAHAAFLAPLSPNPSRPAGREGSLTTLFDAVAPNALLRSQGRHGCFARRLCAYGRSGRVAVSRANGGRVAARVRCSELGSVAGMYGGRAAARSGCTNLRPFTTTAGSPTPAFTCAPQHHPSSTRFGAQRPNVVLSSPLARRGERGWGRVGETKATRTINAASTSKVAKNSTLSKGENT
jgi:hypothetical protein